MGKCLQRGIREGANEHVFFKSNKHCNVNKCQREISLCSGRLVQMLFTQRLWGEGIGMSLPPVWHAHPPPNGRGWAYTEAMYISWKCILNMKGEWGSNSGGKNRLSVTTGNPCMWQSVVLPSSMVRGNTPHVLRGSRQVLHRKVTPRVWLGNDTGNKQQARRKRKCSSHSNLLRVLTSSSTICDASGRQKKTQNKTVLQETPCWWKQRWAASGIRSTHAVILYCLDFSQAHTQKWHKPQVSGVTLGVTYSYTNNKKWELYAADTDEQPRWSCGSIFWAGDAFKSGTPGAGQMNPYIKRLLFCSNNTPPTVSSYCTAT